MSVHFFASARVEEAVEFARFFGEIGCEVRVGSVPGGIEVRVE